MHSFLVLHDFHRVHFGKQISGICGLSEKGRYVLSIFNIAIENGEVFAFPGRWKGIGSVDLELREDGIRE